MTEQAHPNYDIAEEEEGFCSLDRAGWAGALFRISLRMYGNTFVGKGTVRPLIRVLHHEARMYEDHLGHLQGAAVPVYVGSIDLAQPYWLTCSIAIEHLLCMSWGGEEAWRYSESSTDAAVDPTTLARETARTLGEIQATGIDLRDLRDPNILWNAELQRVLLIDFEYAKVVAEPVTTDVEYLEGKRQQQQQQVVVKKASALQPLLREISANKSRKRGQDREPE